MNINSKEYYYPSVQVCGYTYSRFKNLDYINHLHHGIECVCVLGGTLQASVDKKNYTLKAGDIAFVMPFHNHSYQTRYESDIFGFSILPEMLSGVPYFSGGYTLKNPIIREGKYSKTINLLMNLLLDDETRTSNAMIQLGLLKTIVAYLFEVNPPEKLENVDMPLENRVLLYLEENMLKSITETQVAEHLGISTFKLSRICNQEIGMSFNAYLRFKRIASAKRRLIFTNESINDISQAVGFDSPRSFYRAFSEETGTTPRSYRSANKHSITLDFKLNVSAEETDPED